MSTRLYKLLNLRSNFYDIFYHRNMGEYHFEKVEHGVCGGVHDYPPTVKGIVGDVVRL